MSNSLPYNCDTFQLFDPRRVPSPCFVVDEVAVERNLKILDRVQQESGATILMALKAFSMPSMAPLISRYLKGCCASGLHEAKLAHEEFGGELHTFSAAFSEQELPEILALSDHIVFNSWGQWQRFRPLVTAAQQDKPNLQVGLRVNPQHSEGTTEIYDPCAKGSRLGIIREAFAGQDMAGISGLHFHTLCEQGADALQRTLAAVEQQFAEFFPQLSWINFGGGHHISKPGYDVDGLIALIKAFRQRHPHLKVYLEPGEAIAIHSGVLVAEVIDITHNNIDLAILDTSATCHMPDTLEMPYRADIFGAGEKNEKAQNYRLGGQTCLAGDVMGDYSFEQPLAIGQRLMFDDMAHYTMVKTSTFNGIKLPTIAKWNSNTDELTIVREFGYDDFKSRL